MPNPGEIGLFGLKVGSWLHYQRKRLREGLLTKDKIDKLKDLLGVDLNLNPMIEKWKRNYAAYKDYVTSTGKQPDRRTISNDVLIGVWLDYLRKHKNALSVDQIQQLDALGIRWTKLRESTHKLLEANRTRRKLLGPYVPEEEIEEHQPAGEGWIRSYMLCKEFLSLPEDKGKLTSGAIYKNEPIGAWFELQVRRFYKNKLSPENRSRVSILLRLSEVRIRRSILKNPAD